MKKITDSCYVHIPDLRAAIPPAIDATIRTLKLLQSRLEHCAKWLHGPFQAYQVPLLDIAMDFTYYLVNV